MTNYYRPFGGFSAFTPVVKNLLIINVIVFFFQLVFQTTTVGQIILAKWLTLNPINLEGYNNWPYNFQVWQLITYQFMHGGFFHILFNMLVLWMLGMEVENLLGSKKFLYYYLICGVVAGLAQLFIAPLFSTPAPTIGASGAVFGVMIAFALMFPDRYLLLIFPPIPIKAKYMVGFLILVELFWVGDAGSNVAHLAHLGGALAGFVFIMIDSTIDVPLKRMFNRSSGFGSQSNFQNPFSGLADKFKQRSQNIEDAKYYDINQKKDDEEISQEEIDKILDKISQAGYQNLTEREKKILFEASKKMN